MSVKQGKIKSTTHCSPTLRSRRLPCMNEGAERHNEMLYSNRTPPNIPTAVMTHALSTAPKFICVPIDPALPWLFVVELPDEVLLGLPVVALFGGGFVSLLFVSMYASSNGILRQWIMLCKLSDLRAMASLKQNWWITPIISTKTESYVRQNVANGDVDSLWPHIVFQDDEPSVHRRCVA